MNPKFQFSMDDLVCVIPMLTLFLGSLLPITFKVLNKNKEPNPLAAMSLALVGILTALVTSLVLFRRFEVGGLPFSNTLVIDGLAVFSFIAISLMTLFTTIFSKDHPATTGPHFSEYLFLVLNAGMGMMLFVSSNDLIMMFVAIEVMSLCLYLAIALSKEEILSKEAAFKYFILGSFASAIYLYGIAMIYGTAGTTQLSVISGQKAELLKGSSLFVLGLILVTVGVSFKAALVPFHSWAPDVYQGAATPMTGYMAAGVKFVTFIGFLRLLKSFVPADPSQGDFVSFLQWIAVLTMVIGNIAAIMQSNLKRMLAYSSVAHSGYVFIGVIAALVGGESWRGDVGVVYYLVAYGLTTIGAFGVVCLLERHEGDIVSVENLKGMGKKHPLLAFVFTVFLLSLAGIPPLIGFFGKLFIFTAAIQQGLIWLAIWGAISSVIGVYYYLRPVVYMYMKEEMSDGVVPANGLTYTLTVALAGLVILFGIIANPIYEQVKVAVMSFL